MLYRGFVLYIAYLFLTKGQTDLINSYSFKLALQVFELVVVNTTPIILTSIKENIMGNLPKKSVVATSSKEKEEIAGYGNIKVKTVNKAGKEKLTSIGIYGLMLRDSNKTEKALLDLMRAGDIETLEGLELVIDITLLDDDVSEDDEVVFVTKQ